VEGNGNTTKLEEDFTNVEWIAKKELKYKASRGYRLRNIRFVVLLVGLVGGILLYFTSSSVLSYGVLIILFITIFYLSCRLEPYMRYMQIYSNLIAHNNLIYEYDEIHKMYKYMLVKDDGENNYLIYDLTSPCIYDDYCGGKILIVDAPPKMDRKIWTFAGKCSLCKEQHSYTIDNNFVATKKQDLDWGIPEKTRQI
jgi:hypothetical protein